MQFAGERASSRVKSIGLVTGEEHIDFNVLAQHGARHCRSEQEARVVAAGRGRGVVQSLVKVGPLAAGTDARQLIRGLILGERAEIDAKPELEILNDDVKCAHGTALGDLDAEAIFYLRARGIPEREARALLIEAFLGELIAGVAHAGARALLLERTRAWLGALGLEGAAHG